MRELLQRIFAQYPGIHFRARNVAVANLFDFVGNNTAYIHWDVELENHEGVAVHLSGITVATTRWAKVVRVEDVFDASSEAHQRSWATSAPRPA